MVWNAKKSQNTSFLEENIDWFEKFLWVRGQERSAENSLDTAVDKDFLFTFPPPRVPVGSPFEKSLGDEDESEDGLLMRIGERAALMLALAPYLRPEMLDMFLLTNTYNRIYTQFGGLFGSNHRGFLPTGETLLYLLSGTNLELRFFFLQLFSQKHFFARNDVLHLAEAPPNEPPLSGQLIISEKFLRLLTTGEEYQPQFSSDFPAVRLETKMSWDDLVLNHDTHQAIQEVRMWLRQYQHLMDHPILGKEASGYKCLLHGEPGTGKTLTVKLLGKEIGADVYRIDLSKIVSKYIGETEKNLYKIFEMAKNQNWILFFDEGDALFGKRSEAKSSNDRYANQETAFLLQKMEEHEGILLLATNIRANLDKAFLRRFQSDVYFGIPDENSRLLLWQKAFEGALMLDSAVDLEEIAHRFHFTGATIHNIRQQCAVLAFDKGHTLVTEDDLQDAIKKQLQKDGKTL